MKKLISAVRKKVILAEFSWWNFWAWVFISKYTRTRKPLWSKAHTICHHRENAIFQEVYAMYYNN